MKNKSLKPHQWTEETLREKWSEYAKLRDELKNSQQEDAEKEKQCLTLRNEIVTYYLDSKLVNTVIKKFRKNDYLATGYTNYEQTDYKNIVSVALIEVVEKYDPTYVVEYVSDDDNEQHNYKSKKNHNVCFEEFANPLLRNAVLEHLRSIDPLSRYSRDAYNAVKAARKKAGEDASDADIITYIIIPKYVIDKNPAMTPANYYKAGIKAEQFAVIHRPAIMSTMYVEDLGDDEDTFDIADQIADVFNFEDEFIENEGRKKLLEIISKLSDKEKYVLKHYFGIGLENEEDKKDLKTIGLELKVNESRVSQIKSKALKTLKHYLTIENAEFLCYK